MDVKKIDKIWETDGKHLIKPSILLAQDVNNKIYFIIEDKYAIVFMVLKDSNITFCIPKKYLRKEISYYYILNNSKLIPTSCKNKKNELEDFVQKKLLQIKF
jgi:hypothetical protein